MGKNQHVPRKKYTQPARRFDANKKNKKEIHWEHEHKEKTMIRFEALRAAADADLGIRISVLTTSVQLRL